MNPNFPYRLLCQTHLPQWKVLATPPDNGGQLIKGDMLNWWLNLIDAKEAIGLRQTHSHLCARRPLSQVK